ncbi:MAG: hypothetical protein HOP13_05245, partial [Alphaproteobacteria bacterium]|nr:hypothetical protein [Alphaproteobacteria bacterium]
MNDRSLFRLAGAAAMLGGAMRVATAFVPWAPGVAWLEAVAFAIDVLLLFGLMGVYLAHRAVLGWAGLAAFVLAVIGIASIVGPDAAVFGIDTYLAGVHAISVGLAVLGLVMLSARVETIAAIFWLASLGVGLAGGFIGQGAAGFLIGGILFAL